MLGAKHCVFGFTFFDANFEPNPWIQHAALRPATHAKGHDQPNDKKKAYITIPIQLVTISARKGLIEIVMKICLV
jgi:hypothetical protein